ncbi:MAG TPA: mechanosensitive ion channel domain-containing protein [Acidisoma sp.]|uniref:mechanosensitive ion channel domain-containing protein n=1 Tax=Acidisoma sp. TaxID=1872115 RepID=UPI002D0771E3|nr:mechanosensitive ion channel domain-containing protein [Acidisoma sp.]HTH99423.1 mechanosensitive ion channel domain-containing protein [Acidisoma sp.]
MMSNSATNRRSKISAARSLSDRPRPVPQLRQLLLLLGVFILALGFGAGAARAQVPQSAPKPATVATSPASAPSTSDLQNLADTLQDPARRADLLAKIQALIAAQQSHPAGGAAAPAKPAPSAKTGSGPGEALIGVLSGGANYVGGAIAATAASAPFTGVAVWGADVVSQPARRIAVLRGLALVVVVVALALAARQVVLFLVFGLRRRFFHSAHGPIWIKLFKAVILIILGLLPIAAFMALGYAALSIGAALPGMAPEARLLTLDLLNAMAIVLAIQAVAAALLRPAADGTRLIALDEASADYWLIWVSRLSQLLVYVGFAAEFAQQIGLPRPQYDIIIRVLGLLFLSLVVMLVLQNRRPVASLIRGHREGSAFGQMRGRLAEIWHVLAILYLIGVYGVWAAGVPGSFDFLLRASILTIAACVVARFVIMAGTTLLGRFLAISPALGERVPGLQNRVNLYAPLIINIGRAIVDIIAVIFILEAWGLGTIGLVTSPAGQWFIGRTCATLVTAIISVVVWEAVSLLIELYLARPSFGASGPDVDTAVVARSARIRTVLPLFRKAFAIVLGIIVVLIALSEFGVNIAPLLAGAGIVGIAVGFGAQSLVKDVITGVFVLMQDAVSVGDVVDVGNGHSGFVEQITIRSIRLRDQSGTVLIVPFSEVSTVKNMTKDFAFALFSIGVAYREDVDYVMQVVIQLSEELRQEEDFAWRITDKMEMLGLDSFGDSAVVIKCRIKTRPIHQWTVMREFNRRMKRRFDELGIEIPFPHQTIYFGADRAGKAPPAHIAIEQPSAEIQPG